jgi:CheY-like chemotaxis protein
MCQIPNYLLMPRHLIFILTCGLLYVLVPHRGHAQATQWRDSLQQKIQLLTELYTATNYERAQVEAGQLRAFMQQQYIQYPATVVPLVSGIYIKTKDRINATRFLEEAERSALRNKNFDQRVQVLTALIREHERWGDSDKATQLSDQLHIAQDSLTARQIRTQTARLQLSNDSLRRELITAKTQRDQTVTFQRDHVLAISGGVVLAFLAFLGVHNRMQARWRKRWEDREAQHDIQMSHLRAPAYIPPVDTAESTVSTAVTPAAGGTSAYFTPRKEGPSFGDGLPTPVALVIEPNRQVALYVRSLLSNHYDVEMASNATEGLKLVQETLPDIIVCDTQLNGLTGIEITRQIKLNERTNHIPVVLLSKHYGQDGRLDALRAGADAWFTRPVLDDEFEATVSQLQAHQLQLHDQFGRYLQLYFSGNRQPQPNRFLSDVVTYIETHLADANFMPDEIARKMQMTGAHFNKKLRALTGKEPTQLIRELRLEKARFLLQHRAGTPQAIGEMVGFSSQGTFALAFKAYFGEHTMLLK